MIWLDQTRTSKELDIDASDLGDLRKVPSSLRSDLFKSRIQIKIGSVKAVTITAYYTTGTIHIQGTRCVTWVREEFDALIATVRAIYALTSTKSSMDLKEVEDGLHLLPPPSTDSDG